MTSYDAIVVGSGPNGLSAAIVLARAGLSVLVRETSEIIGGGTRTSQLTLPGFLHDICSAVHPTAVSSPFFRSLPLAEHGLEWIHPPAPLAHPFDDEPPAFLERSVTATGDTIRPDASAYRRLMSPLVSHWDELAEDFLGPIVHLPAHPFRLASFGFRAVLPASRLVDASFRGPRAKALFAGMAAHSIVPLEKLGTSAFGLVMGAAGHAVGWPIPRGGAQQIAEALASYLRSLGGVIETNAEVTRLDALPPSRAVLFDLTPRQILRIASDRLPRSYQRRLQRFRYGPGVFKIDWALSAPIPWKYPECARSATVHLGGSANEIGDSEDAAWTGSCARKPFVLLVQPSLFDSSRAPSGRHTGWAYCHVPNGSTEDMAPEIEMQVERFAPGFRDLILARHTKNTAQLEQFNANIVGGDIVGGANTLGQLIARPVLSWSSYRTPAKGLYICSSSSPPGGAVHGMCGYHAAVCALKHSFGRQVS